MSFDLIRKLEAEREMHQVLRRYCRSMDRIDAPLGYTVWHEDGLADYGPLFQGTGRGFIDWVCEYHRPMEGQSHQIANTLISWNGERVSSETYITVALLHREEGQQVLTTGRGRYLDDWSHRDGRWAIDSRHYVHDFAFTQPVTAMMGWGARDLTDPSYTMLGALGAA